MTYQPLVINRKYLAFGFVFTAFVFVAWLVKSPVFHQHSSQLSEALTVDLLLTIPLVYALLIHKTGISKLTVLPLLTAGMVSASYFIPAAHQQWLHLFKLFFFPLTERVSLWFIVQKFIAVRRQFSKASDGGGDFFEVLKKACYSALPRMLAAGLVSEISVIYYGLINWKTRRPASNEFTYHRNSGMPALLGCMVFLILMESAAMHLLITRWSGTLAWIFSGISLYTALQFLSYAKSLSKRFIAIEEDQLVLRYGIMAQTHILIQHIHQVELSARDVTPNAATRKLSPLGQLESHSVILHLKRDHVLQGLFGIRHRFRTLLLHVDDKVRFKAELEAVIKTHTA
jgi:hypothetical protein